MKLSIIIVSYNVKSYLEQCLISLQRATEGIEADIYVVDNHSKDGSVDFLSKRFSQVNFVESNHNLGFSRANNIAIRQSEGEFILLINPDTFVGEHVIGECLAFMESHPDAGALGLCMLGRDGEAARESRRGIPTPLTAFYKMTGLCAKFPKNKRLGRYYMSYLPWDEPAEIEIVSGAFCMLRRAAIEQVGLLDEDFFMYGEDIDLSYRILKGGFKNWYLPQKILHYKGESTEHSSFRYIHIFYDAMLIFFRKHYRHMSFWLSIPIKTAIYLKATVALIVMLTTQMRRSLGFLNRKRRRDPNYLFIGQQTAIDQCRKIARFKGLFGDFVVADATTHPDGHNDEVFASYLTSSETRPLVVVYDTDSYSFEQILDIFYRQPRNNVFIGTYNRKTRTIIRAEEVIK